MTPGPQTTGPRRRGWRIPAKMPRTGSPEYLRLREELGPCATPQNTPDFLHRTPEEMERLYREFKEPTVGEIRAFRLRHRIPSDWKITKCAAGWLVESPLWPRLHPTPECKFVRMARAYDLEQQFYIEFTVEMMEFKCTRSFSKGQCP